MEDLEKDDMGSLFEGMILFSPTQIVEGNDVGVSLDPVASVKDNNSTVTPRSVSPSEALDENLFSDLTIVTPIQVDAVESSVQSHPSQVSTSATRPEVDTAPASAVSRQVSRRKKRSTVRIGYGRDSQLLDDQPSILNNQPTSALDRKPSSIAETSEETYLGSELEGNRDSSFSSADTSVSHDPQTEQVSPAVSMHKAEAVDTCSEDTTATSNEQTDTDDGLKCTLESSFDSSSSQVEEEINNQKEEIKEEEEEEEMTSEDFEMKYKGIKEEVSKKLMMVKESAASISAVRKESGRRRRKAYENVDLASSKYRDLEKKLEEACEAEDFELAESLSENLAAAEKEKECLLNELRNTEVECDAIDSKMEEVLELQIATEEEYASLLQKFSEHALRNANIILENVEVNSSKEMEEWFSSFEALEVRRMDLEVQSHIVNEARSGLNSSIDHLVENEIREKELLSEKKKLLSEELERLLALVREKEAEIAENDSRIEEVNDRIAKVASGFENVRSGIVAKSENLQLGLSEVELHHEALSKKQMEIDDFISREKDRSAGLMKLATLYADLAKDHKQNLELRKNLLRSILKSRHESITLARTEEKILADIQKLRQEISAARASLQELSSRKSSIQQEMESSKQRMLFIDKRVPELEAEKKGAAAARNFKEAARISAEARTLNTEKENVQKKVEEMLVELSKLEEEIKDTAEKVLETEGLISLGEKEAAVARFQRLRLVASASRAERSAALELGDSEEASILLAEAEAAEVEAKQLQLVHSISDEDFEILPRHVISMELVSSLDGEQLAELATSPK